MGQRQGPMAAKTVLVTGGSGGIGRATALGLAAMGAHLAICGRDRESTQGAAVEVRAAGGGRVEVFVADLSSQVEVRRLVGQALQRLPRIDVRINNVGGYWDTRHVSADGLEHTFALNHLAPFLLTNLLVDRLIQSGPARVVTVSSNAHSQGRIDFDDLQGEPSYAGARAYGQSKLANVLFTYELARRLQGTSVTANALHPGLTRTAFGAEDPAGIPPDGPRPTWSGPAGGDPHGVPASSLRADLRPQAHTVVKHLSSHGQRGHDRKAATSFLVRPALSGMPRRSCSTQCRRWQADGIHQAGSFPSARPTGPASGGEKAEGIPGSPRDQRPAARCQATEGSRRQSPPCSGSSLQGHACKLRGPAHPG